MPLAAALPAPGPAQKSPASAKKAPSDATDRHAEAPSGGRVHALPHLWIERWAGAGAVIPPARNGQAYNRYSRITDLQTEVVGSHEREAL